MKTKNFYFQQTVTEQVKTRYDYKIKAKSYEEAEEKLKKMFQPKIEKGAEHAPIKKLDPKRSKAESVQLAPTEKISTVEISYVGKKKKIQGATELYNNASKIWKKIEKETSGQVLEDAEPDNSGISVAKA